MANFIELLKKVWPLLLTQSDAASIQNAKHVNRLADADAERTILKDELISLRKMRDDAFNKALNTSGIEAFQLQHVVESIDARIRLMTTCKMASEVAEKHQRLLGSPTDTDDAPIPDEAYVGRIGNWMDAFRLFAERQNEEWRMRLLSEALAREITAERSVALKTVWQIGMMDADMFDALATFFSVCFTIDGLAVFHPSKKQLEDGDAPVLTPFGHEVSLGGVMAELQEEGLLTDVPARFAPENPSLGFQFVYGTEVFRVLPARPYFKTDGLYYPTETAMQIFKLYSADCNEFGRAAFLEYVRLLAAHPELKVSPDPFA